MKPAVLIISVISIGLFGCASTSAEKNEIKIYLGEKPDFKQMRSFQNLLKATPGTEEYEKARIDYLLERLSKSAYNFIRHHEAYSNARAVVHIKWKYLRYRKEASTAEFFIKNVASRSKISGRYYLIDVGSLGRYRLMDIWYNELELLDQGFLEHQETITKQFEESKELREEVSPEAPASEGEAEEETGEKSTEDERASVDE